MTFRNARVLAGIVVIACHAATASASASSAAASTASSDVPAPIRANARLTDSVISDISALDRTRPFPPGDKILYFTNVKDGDRVRSPFRVAFAVSGMGVSPVAAGAVPNTGHHHILIDMPLPVDIKKPLPFDPPSEYLHQHYKHFGGGQTEAVLNLPPGRHTLQLLFANHSHVPYYIDSRPITIEVLPPAH